MPWGRLHGIRAPFESETSSRQHRGQGVHRDQSFDQRMKAAPERNKAFFDSIEKWPEWRTGADS